MEILFPRLSVPKECLHLTESGSLVSRLPAAPSFRSQFSRFVSQKVKEGEREREKEDQWNEKRSEKETLEMRERCKECVFILGSVCNGGNVQILLCGAFTDGFMSVKFRGLL